MMESTNHKKRPCGELETQEKTKKSRSDIIDEQQGKSRIPLQDISNHSGDVGHLDTKQFSTNNLFSSSSSSFFSISSVSPTINLDSNSHVIWDEYDPEEEDEEEDSEYSNESEEDYECLNEFFTELVCDTNHAVEKRNITQLLIRKQNFDTHYSSQETQNTSRTEKYFLTPANNFKKCCEDQKLLMASSTYMSSQTDISEQMRSILVDWLVEVADEFRYKSNILFLAVCYVDCYLSKANILREKLQLVGIAAIIIAVKQEENICPAIDDFIYISDNTYSKIEIAHMEHQVKTNVGPLPSYSTIFSFLNLLQKVAKVDEEVLQLSRYLSELSLLQYSLLKFEPSRIAASAIALSLHSVGCTSWPKNLEQLSGYKANDLSSCVEELLILFNEAGTTQLVAIHDKYSHPNPYLCVSAIPAPLAVPL